MIIDIAVCFAGILAVLLLLRRDKLSVGLPLAYLALLLLIHVPGAIAQVVGRQWLEGYEITEVGLRYTAIGVVCFTLGVWLARQGVRQRLEAVAADRRRFAIYCLAAGWATLVFLAPFSRIPSIGAAINSGAAIWMLGVLVALRYAVGSGNISRVLGWSGALAVYPALMLLVGGFMSYGASAVTIVLSVLPVVARTVARATVGILIAGFFGLTIFVNYFEHRDNIRESIWGGASMEDRIGSVLGMFNQFHVPDLSSKEDLNSLNTRLNQNLFVGLAAERLQEGATPYLDGETIVDSVIYLVPRAVWPDKPATGGSGDLVARTTGLQLNEDTSWGVGNVLEFYINFGLAGIIIGFGFMGWLIGALDLRAAIAERQADFKGLLIYFLPGVALVQPGSSLSETAGAAVAAVVAAIAWQQGWNYLQSRLAGQERTAAAAAARSRSPA